MTVATFWALEEILAATLTILFPWVATKCKKYITKQNILGSHKCQRLSENNNIPSLATNNLYLV